ncbi:helix-turn-helix domain-containing protein [Endozoicomonas atrinae]|uniref:helix-turn-helix domain-containing protein n=1 Tax=Endozoicomonas atrinae TaxID=1333660 RepID=UPI000824F435|nr:helix-turn-helix domain-containing protein [Endozoicomonas atrinae]
MEEHISDRIKIAMDASHITSVPELAKITGIPKSYLYQLNKGDIDTPHKHIKTLSEALNVSSQWLMKGVGIPPEEEKAFLAEEIATIDKRLSNIEQMLKQLLKS